MRSLPPPLTRFVPTLTEVVEPSLLAQPVNDGATSQQALIDSLTLQMSVVIERRFIEFGEAVIRTILAEQLQLVKNNLKLELDETIKQVVHQAYPIKQHLFCKFRFWLWGCCAKASG